MNFMKNTGFSVYWLGFFFSLLISITFATQANAATSTVTNTNDSGAGGQGNIVGGSGANERNIVSGNGTADIALTAGANFCSAEFQSKI